VLVLWLRGEQRRLDGIEVLLAHQSEGEHGPRQAPLIEAFLEQRNLEERLEDFWKQVRALVDVLCEDLYSIERRLQKKM
jgi:hypothetical protein